MKNITIAGGITRDAVTRTTQQGDKVTGFSVAVSEGFGDSKRTLYFDCSLWGNRGEKLAGYLTKGSRVAVSGDLSTREHEGRTYLTVRASEVTLLGGGNRDDGMSDTARAADRAQRPTGGGRPDLEDDLDSIPF